MDEKVMDRPAPVRLLLADDHRLVRQGVRRLLETDPRLQVVGEAADGEELLTLAAARSADVVVMDIAMPVLNGLDALPRLQRVAPRLRAVMLSMYASAEYVHHALERGAAGYVLKNACLDILNSAVHAVARGELFLCPGSTRQLVEGYARYGRRGLARAGLGRLTDRQREVLRLIAEGTTTKGIAQRLGVSVKTVESHRGEISRRLGAKGVAGLVREAIRLGLVTTECSSGLESLLAGHGCHERARDE